MTEETGSTGPIARTSQWRSGDLSWLAGAAAIVAIQQIAIRLFPLDGAWEFARAAIFFVTTAAVLAMTYHFRRFVGGWIVAAGIVMNFVPMAAHGGLMPISYELIRETGAFPQVTDETLGNQLHRSKDIILHEDEIRFQPLSDRFFLRIPGYGPNIFSAGDFVLGAGVLVTAVEASLMVAGIELPTRWRRRPGANATPVA